MSALSMHEPKQLQELRLVLSQSDTDGGSDGRHRGFGDR
jgi:hypothetical protein